MLFTMNKNRNTPVIMGRRNFMRTAILCPFIFSSLSKANTVLTIPLNTDNSDEFVIIGGWVLLKDDVEV